MAAHNYRDLTGTVKDHLTCIGDSGKRDYKGGVLWLWRCSCGEVVERSKSYINKVRTCGNGCPYSREIRSEINRGRPFSPKGPPGRAGAMRLFDIYRKRGEKRGGFDLTFDQFRELTSQDCRYCGAPPSMVYVHQYDRSERARRHGEYVYNSLDRIDCAQGYLADNVAPSCHLCNMMKRTMSDDDFRRQVIRIYRHYIKGDA
jgi:hypothetical protein